MGKTFQYLLVSLFSGLVFLIPVYFIAKSQSQQLQCGVKGTMHVSKPTPHAAGERLFKNSCASCHKLNAKLIGPALSGVEQRWIDAAEYQGISGREWLKRFIRNWQDPVEAGNPYALQIVWFDGSAMTQFPQLSIDDIDSILSYIQSPPVGPVYLPVYD